MPSNKKKSNDPCKVTYEHLWNHFELHAKQRVDMFKYYIAFYSIFMIALTRLEDIKFMTFIIPFLLLIITGVFNAIENRNKKLIDYSREALCKYEMTFEDSYQIFRKDKDSESCIPHHSKCYFIIFVLGYVLSLAILGYFAHTNFDIFMV